MTEQVIDLAEECGLLTLGVDDKGWRTRTRVPLREAAEAGQTGQEK